MSYRKAGTLRQDLCVSADFSHVLRLPIVNKNLASSMYADRHSVPTLSADFELYMPMPK